MRNPILVLRRSVCFAGAAIGALSLGTAAAQSPEPTPTVGARAESPGSGAREGELLRDHEFLQPQLQESGFVVTAFTSRLGVAMDRVDDVPFGLIGPRDLRLGGLQQQLEVSGRINRKIGLFIAGKGGVQTGLNTTSLILRTGELQGEVRGGAMARLYRSDRSGTQVSARLSGGYSSGRTYGVLPLFESAADNPIATGAAVLEGNLSELALVPLREQQARASVHFAQAFTPALSLQATVGATGVRRTERPFNPILNERVEVTSNGVRGDGAVAFAVDGSPARVPVAFLAEYRLNVGRTEQERITDAPEQTVGASLFYSGRRDLQLGLEGSYRVSGPRLEGFSLSGGAGESDPIRRATGAMLVRYTW